ncbi:V-type ATP synthase subunit D [bacterium SCSIO 12741]|nr:V-type ATP synthase subunit D [bacterium SCSIO 12741]
MAIKYQFNKTSLQVLNKSLKMRMMALPIIKNKESALRQEVKLVKAKYLKARDNFDELRRQAEDWNELWSVFEFDLLQVSSLDIGQRKIAGVRVPVYRDVTFEYREVSWIGRPDWYADALLLLQQLIEAQVKTLVFEQELQILERERKRTTQKVNLYEKVQIPEIEDGIKKIKRFLEDEENLSKAAQKMVKARQAEAA